MEGTERGATRALGEGGGRGREEGRRWSVWGSRLRLEREKGPVLGNRYASRTWLAASAFGGRRTVVVRAAELPHEASAPACAKGLESSRGAGGISDSLASVVLEIGLP